MSSSKSDASASWCWKEYRVPLEESFVFLFWFILINNQLTPPSSFISRSRKLESFHVSSGIVAQSEMDLVTGKKTVFLNVFFASFSDRWMDGWMRWCYRPYSDIPHLLLLLPLLPSIHFPYYWLSKLNTYSCSKSGTRWQTRGGRRE